MRKLIAVFIWMLFCASGFSQLRYGEELGNLALFSVTSKSGELYAGIENKLMSEISNSTDNIFLTTNNGLIFEDTTFIVIPQRPGIARIEVFSLSDSEKKIIGYRIFKVNPVPEPRLLIDSLLVENNFSIPIKALLNADCLRIFYSTDIIGSLEWYSIRELTIGYSYGGHYRSINNIGCKLNTETKKFISLIGANHYISINAIIQNESLIVKNLPLIKIFIY